jgi:hypothetical protein
MKSGTSSLYEYLSSHPDIFMSKVKEPMHFSRRENWSLGHSNYLKLFKDANKEVFLGEASTEYAKMPFRKGVAKRLYDFNPKARIIYIMRDPYDRIVSQYKFMVKAGEERKPLSHAVKQFSDYLTNSYYAYQLRPYMELFGKEAIFIDVFETMSASPSDFCKRVFQWLKIDDSFVPPNYKEAYHVSPFKLEIIDDHTVIGKTGLNLIRMTKINKALPKALRNWIAKVLSLKTEIDFSSKKFKTEVAVTLNAIRPILFDWICELEEVTGRCYDMWATREISTKISQGDAKFRDEVRKCIEVVLAKG